MTILPQNINFVLAGFSGKIEDYAEILRSLGGFLNSLRTALAFLTDIIGVRAIILFIAAVLVGSGLSFFGIPKGKKSFFVSLIIVDVIWLLWIKNFSRESADIFINIIYILKANLVLLIPFVIIYIFKSSLITKKIIPKIIIFIKSPFKKRHILQKTEAKKILEKLMELNTMLQRSLISDMLNNDSNVILSPDTLKHKKELESLLKGFDDSGSYDKVDVKNQ